MGRKEKLKSLLEVTQPANAEGSKALRCAVPAAPAASPRQAHRHAPGACRAQSPQQDSLTS